MPMPLFGKARIIFIDVGAVHYRDVSVLNKNFSNKEKLYQCILKKFGEANSNVKNETQKLYPELVLKEFVQIMTDHISSDESNLSPHVDEIFHRLTNLTLTNWNSENPTRFEGVLNWNLSKEQFPENDLRSVSEGYMLHPEAGTMPSYYLGTGTMSKGYGPML
jgi:hypothetical protein